MKKLLMLAFAAMAFLAIPTIASAESPSKNVFLHAGNPVNATTEVTLRGNAGFVITGSPTGVHCPNLVITADLEAKGTGTVTTFTDPLTDCTGTGAIENLVTHPIPLGLHSGAEWILEADLANKQIDITNITIRNTVTSGGVCVSETVLAGSLSANLPTVGGSTTVTLSNAAGELKSGVNNATVSGHLVAQNAGGAPTSIGVE